VNLLLATIPASLAITYLVKFASVPGIAKSQGTYDNKNPREQQAKLTGWPRRAISAHYNGLEAFAPFAAGVVLCHVTHVAASTALWLALAHVASRLLYCLAYVADVDKLRSSLWSVGFGTSAALLVLAAASAAS
jgi:uncharacterized MAPEG superfamily protein